MYGRKVKLRFLFVVLILITLILTAFLVLKSLEENVVYFQSPSEIKLLSELDKKKIRVGGMVKKDSISVKASEVKFIITDFKNEINNSRGFNLNFAISHRVTRRDSSPIPRAVESDGGVREGAREAGEAGPSGVQRAPRCDTPAEHRAR